MKVILDWDSKYNKGVIVSDHLDVIREHFSVENPNAKMLQRRLGPSARIPLRNYIITSTGRFDIGLYFDIYRYLTTNGMSYDVMTTDPLLKIVCNGYEFQNKEISKLSLSLRDYQERSILKGIKIGRGTIVVATAGGKTLIMANLIETIRKNKSTPFTTLVILPSQLIEQTFKDFIEYGISSSLISQWGGDHDFEKKPIILASVKSLETKLITFKKLKLTKPKDISEEDWKKLKEEHLLKEKNRAKAWRATKRETLKALEDVDLILVDEVHGLRKDNQFNKIIDTFSTQHRFGFTGTMPESMLDQWNIIGKIGPILENSCSYKLRDQGYISKSHATIVQITYHNPPDPHETQHFIPDLDVEENEDNIDMSLSAAYNRECEFLYDNNYRNKVITSFAKNLNKNILILVNRIKHGEILLEEFRRNIPEKKVYFIRGDVPMVEREELRGLMEKVDNIICIAMTKIFSTGINIKNIHYILFAMAGKAKLRMLQSIGRGLRLHENKDVLEIVDIVDETYYSLLHFEKRKEYYEREKILFDVKTLSES